MTAPATPGRDEALPDEVVSGRAVMVVRQHLIDEGCTIPVQVIREALEAAWPHVLAERAEVDNLRHALKEAGKEMDRRYEMGTAAERERLAGAAGDRGALGRLVRETWVLKARTHPDPKPSWLLPWDELDDFQRGVDCLIGAVVAAAERERCAQLAEQYDAWGKQWNPDPHHANEWTEVPFADLVRQEGGAT